VKLAALGGIDEKKNSKGPSSPAGGFGSEGMFAPPVDEYFHPEGKDTVTNNEDCAVVYAKFTEKVIAPPAEDRFWDEGVTVKVFAATASSPEAKRERVAKINRRDLLSLEKTLILMVQ